MKKINLIFTMLIAASVFQACGNGDGDKKDSVEVAKDINDDNSKQVPGKAADFMVKAASGGLMEVELGKIAQDKAQDLRVKSFGAMMVKDHTQANTEMKTMADGKSVTLPSSLGEDHQKHVNELQQKSGAEFDKAYMSMMVDDHKGDIDDFEDAGKLDDADVKAFAQKTLPVLRTHLDSAKAINSVLKR
jgi:putative membrane protein